MPGGLFQRIAKFNPLIMASSSVRLICWESFAGRNQQASSTTAPSYTSDTLVAKELASTHTLRAWPSTHHFPRTRSSLHTLVRTSLIMVLRGALSILSSHPAVTSDALCLMNATATRSQPPTGRSPTNLPHSENTFRRVTTRGMSGILFPLLQYKELSSPQACKHSRTILLPLRLLDEEAQAAEMLLHMCHRHNALVHIHIINIGRCCLLYALVLCQDSINNCLHDGWCDIETKPHAGQAIPSSLKQ